MNGLVLTLKQKLLIRVNMSPVIPDNLRHKKLADIKKIKVQHGNRKLDLGDLFDIDGDSQSNTITIKKCIDKLDFIGHAMTAGNIHVSGNVGDYLGKNMTGGKITVSGNAGQWAGTGMNNAHIEIRKNAGDYLGAAIPENQFNYMKGGLIHVYGNAGTRVGEYMRRGIIAIEGDVGDYCGCRMRAGTILVLGNSSRHTGYQMKRGSIILTKKPRINTLTFSDCGQFELGFINLLFKELSALSRRFNVLNKSRPVVQRIVGDISVAGKGELLLIN